MSTFMSTFTIDTGNNHITIHRAVQDATAMANAEHFRNAAGLATLAAGWPIARMIEIWNSLPGTRPVTKFSDRKTAIARIWKAIQGLDEALPPKNARQPEARPTVPPEGAQTPLVAHPQSPAAKKPSRGKVVRKGKEKLTSAAPNTSNKDTQNKASKKAQFVALLGRAQGATLHELMAATGWQAHSVRGFISGTLGKKMGLTVVSVQAENGKRAYSIKA